MKKSQLIIFQQLALLLLLVSAAFVHETTVTAGQLTGSFANLTTGTQINLTTEGPADWVHWGQSGELDVNRKAGVGQQISDFEILPGQEFAYVSVFQYTNSLARCSWTDGYPSAAVTNTPNGVWVYAEYQRIGTGFKFSVPADTRARTLKLYLGVDSGQGKLSASLSDGSATAYASTFSAMISPSRAYTLTYAANGPGQRLELQWTMATAQGVNPFPNVHLQAAALATPGVSVLPAVSLASPTNGESFAAGLPVLLTAAASDLDGTVAKVAFYADGVLLGERTNSPYTFSWTGAAPGFHKLTAVATDNAGERSSSTPVEAYVYGNGSVLQGALTVFPPGGGQEVVNLSEEGTLDWINWGLSQPSDINRLSNATPLVSNFAHSDSNALQVLDNSYCAWMWMNGTPTLENSYATSGLQARGTTNGFELQLASSPEGRRALVYLGDYATRATVRAYFTNHSAPLSYQPYALPTIYDVYDGVLDLRYASTTPGSVVVSFEGDKLYDVISSGLRLMAVSVQPDNSLLLPPVIANPRATGGGLAFSVLTKSDHLYTVECTPVIPATLWAAITNFPGNDGLITITNPPLPGGKGFYRVQAK